MSRKLIVRRIAAAVLTMVMILAFSAPAMAKIGNTYAANGYGIRVHAKSNGSSEIVGKLNKGDKVIHVASNGNWWKIKRVGGSDTSGWVFNSFLKPASNPAPSLKKGGVYQIYKASKVTVRKGPRSQSTKLGTLKRGKSVKLGRIQGNWAYIKVGKKTGWIPKKYLKAK